VHLDVTHAGGTRGDSSESGGDERIGGLFDTQGGASMHRRLGAVLVFLLVVGATGALPVEARPSPAEHGTPAAGQYLGAPLQS
jgi:hypothetical protein